MGSWLDDGSSTRSDVDYAYAPDTYEDMTFSGIAVGSVDRCRVHKLEPTKCVAFEGPNTGRRFYMCYVPNAAKNCGFVSWADVEWPETMQNSLKRLWSMYEDSQSQRVEEKLENARLMQILVDEKNRAKKNYNSLMDDVKRMLEDPQNSCLAEKWRKIKGDNEAIFDLNRTELEGEVIKLHEKLAEMKEEKSKWEKEMEILKDQKKKAEYACYDLLNMSNVNKEKLRKIKELCADL